MKSQEKRSEPDRKTRPRVEPDECVERREALLDEALEETFPASDPPSIAFPPARRC